MKIRITMILLIILAIIISVVMAVGFHNSVNSHSTVYKALNDKWGMDIPKDANVLYYAQTEDNWFGEGSYYIVYDGLSIDDIKKANHSNDDVDLEIEVDRIAKQDSETVSLLEKVYKDANVSKSEKIKSYDEGFIYHKGTEGSRMLVLSDSKSGKLYIIEDIV